MSEGKYSHKRRQYFVKKEFQLKFILKFCLLVLIGTIISTGILFLLSQNTLTSYFQQSRLVIKSTGTAILPSVVYTNLITLGLVAVATIIVTLFVSHKMAGPMFRFEKDLENIGKGDLTNKVTLRKKDQMTDMADSLNAMTAGLHKKVIGVQTELANILKAFEQNASEDLIGQLKQLHQKIESAFKI